jgi:hypothetical protein
LIGGNQYPKLKGELFLTGIIGESQFQVLEILMAVFLWWV